MEKHQELTQDFSRLNRAFDDEEIFVLLARDAAAPDAIRAWIKSRVRRKLNKPDDEQIKSAEGVAQRMELTQYIMQWRNAANDLNDLLDTDLTARKEWARKQLQKIAKSATKMAADLRAYGGDFGDNTDD